MVRNAPFFPFRSVLSFAVASAQLTILQGEGRIRIRKKRKQRKAPEAPKKALTPYIFFSQEVRPQVKASLPEGTKVPFAFCAEA